MLIKNEILNLHSNILLHSQRRHFKVLDEKEKELREQFLKREKDIKELGAMLEREKQMVEKMKTMAAN
jgi:Tfp pilus assembly protein PilO